MSTKTKHIGFSVLSLLMMGIYVASAMVMISDKNSHFVGFWINVAGSIVSAGLAYSLVRKTIALTITAKILISVFGFLFPYKVIAALIVTEVIIFVSFLQPIQLQERQE